MGELLFWMLVTIVVLALASLVFLTVPDQSQYDEPVPDLHRDPAGVSAGQEDVLRIIEGLESELRGVPRLERIKKLRRLMDDGFTGSPNDGPGLGVEITPVDVDGVACEWVVAPGADPTRRLMYLHGGGFVVGSPKSHRMLTAALSRACGVAVLAVNYRKLPENNRRRAVDDCRTAYRWLCDNGPDGPAEAAEIVVSGDSAGGNLALMITAWARADAPRPVDAACLFSPSTDSTLSNPSIVTNIATDPMLGTGLGPLARLPAPLRAISAMAGTRSKPWDPVMSPLFGNLRGLPPILIQVSDCEMLHDDSVRYANKARASGSPVTLQVWPSMVHVWQLFLHELPEARLAIDEVAAFIDSTRDATQDARAHG